VRVYINNPKENWVVDRFREEFAKHKPGNFTEDVHACDVVWIIAPWTWSAIPLEILKEKKVVCTIHHIVPDKFDRSKSEEFRFRDQFVDYYHVPCESTKWMIQDVLSGLTTKPIFVQPFWANEKLWRPIEDKASLRAKYDIPEDVNLIGSFQRDTEGHDLRSPKLEKGPDIFCDMVERMHKANNNTEVLLAGWRRQYVISRLKEMGVKYHYFELPSFEVVNELYNCLDLYVVGSRYEGGPQAIFECALTKTPIISTDVGAAKSILAKESIYTPGERGIPSANVDHALKRVQEYTIEKGMNSILEFMETKI
jgi:glycosyltransferase involved in cell wall biosynthesis